MMIAETYPTVAEMVQLYCHANDFDLEALKRQVNKEKWLSLHPSFRDDLDKIITGQMFSPSEYYRLTGVDYETEYEVAGQLRKIFDFVYEGGPHP
jgi:hypothetical protein